MVKLLDSYVFREALRYFILSLLTFITLFVIVDFVSNLEMMMKLGFYKELTYVLSRVPLYTVRVIPIAVLVSTMVTLSTFSATSELVAVKALGISVYRFSIPLVVLSFFTSGVSLAVEEFLIPPGMEKARNIKREIGKVTEEKTLRGVWFKDKKGRFVFFWELDTSKGEGKRISILKVKDFSPVERIDALKGIERENGTWELNGVFLRNLNQLKSRKIEKLKVNLGVSSKDIKVTGFSPETMGLLKLYLFTGQLKRLGYNTTDLEIELFSRLAMALLPVVVTVIGIPLGIYNPRNKKGYTLAIAAALIVAMWITISFFLSLGKSGVLPPSYAAFAPLFFYGALGLILLERVET